MSVKIEILDYKYGVFEGTQMISNSAFTSTTDWSTGTGWSISGGAATHSGGNGYLENTNITFIEGKKYKIICKIDGMTQGNFILANHLDGGANGFNYTSDGTYTYEWIQGNTTTTKLRLAGWNGFDGDIWYVEVFPLSGVDWENSVIGELDVTDHSDFPLAMTFQISDIKDLTSTSGDYSKTFKIPATKNNNKLLKHSYIANIDTDVNLTENKKCRILINNLYSLKGLIKITGIGGYGETPSYYNCVFFGNNISWADDLSNKYMTAIDWGDNSKDLAYNKTNIMATWQHEDCDAAAAASAPPIVYPIVSYGNYNPDGEPKTIQLLDTAYGAGVGGLGAAYYGFFNSGTPYGTPNPSPDWRPAIFIKDTLERIFEKAGDGYKINSTFMETDMFKKLVWLLPNFKYNNPEEKYDEFSVESNFTNGVSMSQDVWSSCGINVSTENGVLKSNYGSYVTYNDGNANYIGNPTNQGLGGTKLIPLDATRLNVTLDNGSYVDTINDYITIGEYGYYDLRLNGLEARLANGRKGGSDYEEINTIKVCVNLDVQTVGQTSWVTLDRCDDTQSPLNTNGLTSSTNDCWSVFTNWGELSSVNLGGIWLNKGDKIRLTTGLKITSTSEYGQNFMMTTFTRYSNSSNLDIKMNTNRVEYGQTYDLEEVINTDYKQIDFIKGVAHAFNLQITTDENARVVNIEPFDTFYKDYAEAIDWTYKLDRSKQIEDKWIKSDLKRDIVFKYKSDSKDKKVEARGEQYFNGIKDERPYQETLPKTFEKGENKYENPFFAGTYNGKDKDTLSAYTYLDTAYSACLWTENTHASIEDRPPKGYEFLPRLLYWNKYSPAGAYIGTPKRAFAQTWSSYVMEIAAEPVYATPPSSNIYPQATSINGDDISSPVLSYGNASIRDYNNATGQYAPAVSGKGLFDTYYKTMFEMLKSKPRLRTVYVDLKVKDIVSLDFGKLIYIDGVYWRINKVVDYQPNKNQSTKVELIEWLQVGTFAATAPSFAGGTDPWGSWNPDDGSLDDNNDWGL